MMRMLGYLLDATVTAAMVLAPWAIALALCTVLYRWLVQSSCGGA